MNQTPNPETISPAKLLLKALQAEFKVLNDCLPLAIGIDKQLLTSRPEIDRKVLRAALGMHTKSVRYLKNLQVASTRFNLDESPADTVSDEQKTLAGKLLTERFKKKAEAHKAQQLAQREAERKAAAEQEHMMKLQQLQEKFSRK